jgi:acyl carrier protein
MTLENDALKTRLAELYIKALRLQILPEDVGRDNLVADLGIDSVNSLELLIWVEDEFKIRIEDEELSVALVDSIDTLANYVAAKVRGESAEIGQRNLSGGQG